MKSLADYELKMNTTMDDAAQGPVEQQQQQQPQPTVYEAPLPMAAVAAMYEQNAELLKVLQAMNAREQAPTMNPVPAAVATPEVRHVMSEKTPDVPEFCPSSSQASNTRDLQAFESRTEIKFLINSDRFATEASRSNYVFSRLRGAAADTILPLYATSSFDNWKAIIEHRRKVFGDPDPDWHDAQRLLLIRQNNRPFHEFFAEFGILINRSPLLPPSFKKHLLRNSLSRELTARLANIDLRPLTYEQLVAECHRQAPLLAAAAIQPKRPQYPATTNNSPVRTPSATTTVTTTTLPAAADPMDIDQRRDHRRKNGLCYYCGSAQHRLPDCPTRPQKGVQTRTIDDNSQSSPPADASGKATPLA